MILLLTVLTLPAQVNVAVHIEGFDIFHDELFMEPVEILFIILYERD